MTNLKFNVAQLLREAMASRRDYSFESERLQLDEALELRDLRGEVRFTRTASGVYGQVHARGLVQLVCVRNLEEFDHTVEVDFADQFYSIVDIFSGAALPLPGEDDPFLLTELHMADIGAAIREYALLALPLNPVCANCRDTPITYSVESVAGDNEEPIDARLEALKRWAEPNQN